MKSYSEVLEAANIQVRSRKHLLRMSNVQFRGSRLHDATCHYQWQVTIAGNTYAMREVFKAWGFRWDEAYDLWYKPVKNTIADDVSATRKAVAARLAPGEVLMSDSEKWMSEVREKVHHHFLHADNVPAWALEADGGPDDWTNTQLAEYYNECLLGFEQEAEETALA